MTFHATDQPLASYARAAPRAPAPRASRARGLHVALIMDGNGRWAERRGLPRVEGHREGAKAVREAVRAALAASPTVRTLTLYAFSADNWQRPVGEVCALMGLFERFLRSQVTSAVRERVRVSVIGRRDRLSESLRAAVDHVEAATAEGTRLHVRLAIDYSSREAIWQAVVRVLREGTPTRERFEALVPSGRGEAEAVEPVDLLVRTGGEQRLSDFLLWECAYAELCFLPVMWPDFTGDDFERALASFASRERRFGGLAVSS